MNSLTTYKALENHARSYVENELIELKEFLEDWRCDIEYFLKLNDIQNKTKSSYPCIRITTTSRPNCEASVSEINSHYYDILTTHLKFMGEKDKKVFISELEEKECGVYDVAKVVSEFTGDFILRCIFNLTNDLLLSLDYNYRNNSNFKGKFIVKTYFRQSLSDYEREIKLLFKIYGKEAHYTTKTFKNGNVHFTFEGDSKDFISNLMSMLVKRLK